MPGVLLPDDPADFHHGSRRTGHPASVAQYRGNARAGLHRSALTVQTWHSIRTPLAGQGTHQITVGVDDPMGILDPGSSPIRRVTAS